MLVSSQKLLNNFFAQALLRPSHPLADLKRSERVSFYFSFRNSLHSLTKNCPCDFADHKLSCVDLTNSFSEEERQYVYPRLDLPECLQKVVDLCRCRCFWRHRGMQGFFPSFFSVLKLFFISLDIGMLFDFSLNVDLTRLQTTCGKPKTRENCGR